MQDSRHCGTAHIANSMGRYACQRGMFRRHTVGKGIMNDNLSGADRVESIAREKLFYHTKSPWMTETMLYKTRRKFLCKMEGQSQGREDKRGAEACDSVPRLMSITASLLLLPATHHFLFPATPFFPQPRKLSLLRALCSINHASRDQLPLDDVPPLVPNEPINIDLA